MPIAPKKIRVLIVDDSAVVRQMLTRILDNDPEIEVVATAADPYIARDKILQLKPDVITLDVEMPRMDGLTFLRLLMEHKPLPVLIVSSLTAAGSQIALEALQAGAVDVLAKPEGSWSLGDIGPQIVQKIKAAAISRFHPHKASSPSFTQLGSKSPASNTWSPRQLVLLGASTGGTEALREVITALPADMPPILVVQHIPATFSRAFADRLNQLSNLQVREAVDGERAEAGLVLIAPGNYHMTVNWTGGQYRVALNQGAPVWHQRPAVDVLFRSAVAAKCGSYSTAAILTGMGKDGADGLLELKKQGATTLAQDEKSCVVYGMPKAAAENGAASSILPLNQIANALHQASRRLNTKAA